LNVYSLRRIRVSLVVKYPTADFSARLMSSNDYKEVLRSLTIPLVSLGYTAVHIYRVDELEEAQVGYSVDPSGASLIDDEVGSWQRQWIVIGYEDLCGDPIIIDIEAEGFPVHTAMHGTGNWAPKLISTGLRNFAAAMNEVAAVAKGRENPRKLEANPITPDERARVLNGIQRQNPGIDPSFWETWLS